MAASGEAYGDDHEATKAPQPPIKKEHEFHLSREGRVDTPGVGPLIPDYPNDNPANFGPNDK